MLNLFIALIAFIALVWLAHYYLKIKNSNNNSHCGEPGSISNKFDFYLTIFVDCILYIPRFILSKFKKKFHFDQTPTSDSKIKVAFIGNYGTACGIATYNQFLLSELKHHVDLRLFAEYNGDDKSERLPEDPYWVTRCWTRNQHPKSDLIYAVDSWKPDIIHFSHEYGIWHKAYFFTQLISIFKMKGYKVVSTMHSVYEHMDKLVSESAVPHLIVHTEEGKITLNKKGIEPVRIAVIPHGTKIFDGTSDNPELLPALWNTWNSNYTIFQPGFLFPYKGHSRLLKAVAQLKEKYPDIHYIIQASENELNKSEHDDLYYKLVLQCQELGIEENVTINRGFVSEDVLLSLIRTVKLCVLPYANHPDHDVRAASGAARMVLPTTTPLIVSGVHLFDDLEGVVPRVRDDFELYQEIDYIFSNYDKCFAEQVSKRKEFLRKTSWSNAASMIAAYYKTLE